MLSSAMHIAATGLRSAQKAVDVGSLNIANAETPGYRRRDVLFSTLAVGGVTASVAHRFNEAAATRITELAGSTTYSATRAGVLDQLTSSLSLASTSLTETYAGMQEVLARAALQPDDQNTRVMLGEQARALTSVINASLQDMDSQIAQLARERGGIKGQAQAKIAELAQLNEAAARGVTPEIKDRQAQVGKELAELIGGQLTFGDTGMANFMVEGQVVVQGTYVGEFPSRVGGKLGGHDMATQEYVAARDAFVEEVRAYADTMNSLNAEGLTQAGTPGGELFSFDGTRLHFVGTGDGFALQNADPSAPSVGERMFELNALPAAVAELASRSAMRAAAVASESKAAEASLESAEAARAAEEGVDIDFETLRVKNAQRLYEANAMLIQVADSMLGTLINIRG